MNRQILNKIILVLGDSEKTFEEIEWELDGLYDPEDVKDALQLLVKKHKIYYDERSGVYYSS